MHFYYYYSGNNEKTDHVYSPNSWSVYHSTVRDRNGMIHGDSLKTQITINPYVYMHEEKPTAMTLIGNSLL